MLKSLPINNNSMSHNKPFVLSVHNIFSNGNIPLESFLAIKSDRIEKNVLSFYQNQHEAERFLIKVYPGAAVRVLGFDVKGSYLRVWRYSWRLLKKHRTAIVHVHHSYSALVMSLLCRRFPGIKVVVTVHAEFHYHPVWRRTLLLCALRNANYIICNSKNTRQQLEPWAKYLKNKPIDVIYNGVDIERIQKTSNSYNHKHRNCRPFTVATVGRLIKVKDLPTLLEGFACFRAGKENVRLVIVGDGPEQDALDQYAKKLGLKDSILFAEKIDRSEVYRWLHKIDVFTVTSQAEGFCNSMVEAMAAGCAVVASEINTLKEILGNKNGLFIKPGDSKDLALALERLYFDTTLRKQLGFNAIKRAKTDFSLKSCAQRHADYYECLLEKSP